MNPIELTGLRADLPIGAMAAFGCLRVCQRLPELRGARLAWAAGGVHAVLWTPAERSREELVALLIKDVRKAENRDELKWSEQIKTASRDEFRRNAKEALDGATGADHETADWFSAFGSELVLDREGKIESTPFDMSVARQKFLADARRLAAGLSERTGRSGKTATDAYTEALFGPWKYADDQHSLGWDPTTVKLGAFTYKAPTSMANSGVRAAVWLAFESLPLFPCFYSRGLQLPSFRHTRREFTLCWPVWQAPISLDTLKCLLGWAALTQDSLREKELAARGVTALYRSARFKPNKYLASFRAPELAFGGAASVGR
jgi:hypothetical protein